MSRLLPLPLAIAIAVVTVASAVAAQIPAGPQKKAVIIRGATVHPVSGASIADGVVLFDGGTIRYAGPREGAPAAPAEATVIDATGKHVYPGFVSAFTRLGLTEIGSIRATQDVSELGRMNANVRAEVAFNPSSDLIPVARRNGILTALSVPSGGLISGRSALMMLDGWTWETMTLRAPVGLHVQWPSYRMSRGGRRRGGAGERRPSAEEQVATLSDAFDRARAYQRAKAAGRKDVDLRLDAIGAVLDRRVPVFAHAREIRQIQAAIDWAERQNVNLVIVGGEDAWRVADTLKARKIPVIIGGIHNLPMRRQAAYDEPFTLPKKLHDAGVTFCIATRGDAANERNLPYHAATAVAFGLPRAAAVRAITLDAASILGAGDRLGSLDAGKDATLIITDGDPLEIRSDVTHAFIQGRAVDLDNKHDRLYRTYREKYRQLGLEKR